MANEATKLTINGVQHDVMDVGARQLIASVQAALNAITSGDTTTAIKTFQEVIDFLDGVTDDATLVGKLNELRTLINGKYAKPANGIPSSDLVQSVQDILSDVANKVDKVNGKGLSTNDYTTEDKTKLAGLPTNPVQSISVNGQTQTKDGNGNVNVSVPTLTLDDMPTSGSNNAVKSGGIKTAIDQVTPTINENGKWVIGGAATDNDAQGPRGNTVLVNENAQGIQALIVNNVVDGGEDEILSAEMGKVIRIVIMTIFNALSPYAFTNGKPIISWGSTAIKHDISVNGVTGGITISDIYVDGDSVQSMPAQILDNKSLSFKLNLPNDAYIFNGVAITMNGIDITENSGVWDETTGIVTIASVTGAVVVVATASTYVQDSLVFNLDCRQGVTLDANDVPTKWTDQKGNIEFVLTDVTQNSDGSLVFNGSTSKGISSGALNLVWGSGNGTTVEVIGTRASKDVRSPFLANQTAGSGYVSAQLFKYSNYYLAAFTTSSQPVTAPKNCAVEFEGLDVRLSATKDYVFNGDTKISYQSRSMDYIAGAGSCLAVGYFMDSSQNESFLDGKIMAIRVYNKNLTDAERAQNYKVDCKRFNLQ